MKNEPTFIKYPEIHHLAEKLEILDSNGLQIFEKLDGGNSQVRRFNGRTFCASRANFLRREEDFRFDWFRDFNRWAMSNQSLHNIPENLVVYGEFTAYHTLPYKPEFTNKFFLIDLYDTSRKIFLPYDESRNILESKLHIEDVNFLELLASGKIDLDSIKRLAMGDSQYSQYGREGVVIKDYKRQKFAKLWRTSVNKTREGLIDEIKKTIRSLKNLYPSVSTILETEPSRLVGLPELVYEEILRSGRIDVSLAEISESVNKVVNKI